MSITRHECHFLGAGDIPIVYDKWIPHQSVRAVMVLCHGVGEHARRYDRLIEDFGEIGLITYALDLRGHGRSGGKRLLCHGIREYTGDLHHLVSIAIGDYPTYPLILLGHSMGGAILYYYGTQYPTHYHLMILSAPPVAMGDSFSSVQKIFGKTLGKLCPQLPGGRLDPTLLSHDSTVVHAYQQDPLVHHGWIPVGIGRALLEISETLSERSALLSRPLLVIHGYDDQIVPVHNSRSLIAYAKNVRDLELKLYPNMYHELFNEFDQYRVIADVIGWINDRL